MNIITKAKSFFKGLGQIIEQDEAGGIFVIALVVIMAGIVLYCAINALCALIDNRLGCFIAGIVLYVAATQAAKFVRKSFKSICRDSIYRIRTEDN